MPRLACVFAVAACVLMACRPAPAPARDVEPVDAAPPTPPVASAPPAASSASPSPKTNAPCDAIVARFKAELAKRTDTCTSNQDCACHGAEGGGCGGVTDRATAKRLEPIAAEWHAAGCHYGVLCAAWACEPKCQKGRCVQ